MKGNDIIDKLVRDTTHKIKYNKDHLKYTPYTVTLTQIHKTIKKNKTSS